MRIANFSDRVTENILRFCTHAQVGQNQALLANFRFQEIPREPTQARHRPDVAGSLQRLVVAGATLLANAVVLYLICSGIVAPPAGLACPDMGFFGWLFASLAALFSSQGTHMLTPDAVKPAKPEAA